MKRVLKLPDSPIIVQQISYLVNGENTMLAAYLQGEQKEYCAYTEKRISATDLMEIDHFNPTLKGLTGDDHQNWYLIVAKWNRKKSKKWSDFQPILHPTSADFHSRIWFEDDIYQYDIADIEAKNLVNLLDLNNYELTKERGRYLDRMKDLRAALGDTGIIDHLARFPDQYHYRTAFEATFGYGMIV